MLKIRSEQYEALLSIPSKSFEDEMVTYLKESAPTHCEAVGEDGMREVIRLGYAQAFSHGFTNRGPVSFYIELMVMLGSEFATDPQVPWAAEILADTTRGGQMERADRLHARTMEYAARVFGPGYRYEKESLRRAVAEPPEAWLRAESTSRDAVVARLTAIYPEKARTIGDAGMRGLLERATEEAAANSIASQAGVSVLLGAMFALGHGVTIDPQFPWVAQALRRADAVPPEARVRNLHARTMAWLRASLANVEKG